MSDSVCLCVAGNGKENSSLGPTEHVFRGQSSWWLVVRRMLCSFYLKKLNTYGLMG